MFLLLKDVSAGSLQHLLPIGIGIVFCISVILFAKRRLNFKNRSLLFKGLGVFVAGTILLNHAFLIIIGDYDYRNDLPLWICSFAGLLVPFFTFTRKFWMFEILLFWTLGGSIQGVITPNISEGFPSFEYFRYWITHIFMFSIVFYSIVIFKMWPNFKSPLKSIVALQIYVALIFLLNIVLKTNFFFLNAKPDFPSLLDYIADWPYYIFIIQLIIIPYFLLLYLPFYLLKKRRRKKITLQTTDSYP
ncbi:hypothetical protein BWZ20_12435 [Winogradskyella sp. J14-2]|uniref:YwaF family protein n=1 Tax=Winogradskyella sp. J14-2 TaxID=1936080 RepID=UPI00097290EF|nr:TIGR02206 family membrane protein [Winogradskyella sp. J14-2]APY09059.1 hypothetical protein BWZ20_12435 [Winogradskyella sp. J14-2]